MQGPLEAEDREEREGSLAIQEALQFQDRSWEDLWVEEEALFQAEPMVSVLFRLRAALCQESGSSWRRKSVLVQAGSSLPLSLTASYCFLGQKERALC